MSLTSLEDSEPVSHLLQLADQKFLLYNNLYKNQEEKEKIQNEILKTIKEKDMAPYYENVILEQLSPNHFQRDEKLIQELKEKNQNKIKELDEKIKDAEENLGENEVREALLAKAQHYYDIGDKDNAIQAFRETEQKTVAMGQRLDILFSLMRLGFTFDDNDLLRRNIERANSLIEEGGDWERRNRLKVYEGTYLMSIRNFKGASKLFLESISTFSSSEIMDFETFIFYTIIVSMVSLERPQMKKQLLESSDVLSVVHKMKNVEKFMKSFYDCQYKEFLMSLVDLMDDKMPKDRHLSKHVSYYSREMRVRAYNQFLQSYKSVTMEAMAEQFGISVELLDAELSRFISAGKLNAKIDKVAGIIESNRADEKNALYQQVMKQGDHLLNRIQKLSNTLVKGSSVTTPNPNTM